MITTQMKVYEEMTLQEILHLKNKKLLNKYTEDFSNLFQNKTISKLIDPKDLYGESINDILESLDDIKNEFLSIELFPKKLIKVYLGIEEVHASKDYTCDFSGSLINKGSIYVNYRPMVKNIETGECYILKRTIKTELSYENYLPKNISEIEELHEKILNYRNEENDDIRYDHLYTKTGGLQFKKLNRRRKNENRNS